MVGAILNQFKISSQAQDLRKTHVHYTQNPPLTDNGSNVYLFKNGIAVKTAVEIGELRETDKISIVKGLKSGDKVIVAGVSKLADGEKVKILGGTQ